MSVNRILVIAIIMIIVLFSFGCTKKGDQQKKNQTEPQAIPFPTDVPIYEYSQKVNKQVRETVARATFITSSEVDVVVDYYKGGLEKYGWTRIGIAEDPENMGIIFKKGNRILNLIIKQDLDTEFTHVTLIVKG